MGMKLLLVHNYYQHRGGEDVVFEAEARLLEDHGHHVLRYTARNTGLEDASRLGLGRKAIWNTDTYRELGKLLKGERPAVVHVHNTLPLISPAVYYAARAASIPVVQTLHNYRLLCPSAILFRDGHVCEACLHRSMPTPAVRYACYRGSRGASAAVAAMLGVHRVLGTWTRAVDLFLALTDFARDKFIEGGLPPGKILVKPNFTADPGVDAEPGDYALFVGRLSHEKGLRTLLQAWRQVGSRIRLRVIGDGPQGHLVEAAAQAGPGIDFLGRRAPADVVTAMTGARFLVFPSEWYETFGLAIIEAYAVGLPVVASELGAMSSLVKHRQTGLHFRPGDPAALVEQVEWALAHPEEMRVMGRNARREYEACYTPERNYDLLIDAYRSVARPGSDGDTGTAERRMRGAPAPVASTLTRSLEHARLGTESAEQG
jgi:glycosyltransferase involved in cell wall biosynthesis